LFDLKAPSVCRKSDDSTPIMAHRIDTILSKDLMRLPECIRHKQPCVGDTALQPTFNLAGETLLRGDDLGLSTAQELLGFLDALPDRAPIDRVQEEQLAAGNPFVETVFSRYPRELTTMTPLWYYILREAEILCGGNSLGPLGGRIVAETVHASIEASECSILSESGWQPSLPSRCRSFFSMNDLIDFSANRTPLQVTEL
jgi:hypothetical protein